MASARAVQVPTAALPCLVRSAACNQRSSALRLRINALAINMMRMRALAINALARGCISSACLSAAVPCSVKDT